MSKDGTSAPPRSPVPRSLRIGSFLLSSLLTILIVWLLGFVLDDIGDIDGPTYQAIVDEYVDESLRERAADLELRIAGIETRVARQGELQGDLQRSMDNARETMQQMMELQRLSLEQETPPSEAERAALATAQQRFLEAQNRFEAANAEIASSNETKFQLRQEQRVIEATIETQARPADDDYKERRLAHQFRLASMQLSFIVPLFLLAAWLFWRYGESAYRSILMAMLAATFWKVGGVMFDHFPQEFFKYIAIVAAIVIVLGFLAWMLRKAVNPSRQLLLARHREAYRGHVCPVCAYPIARGPLKFALWTRKGPRLSATAEPASGQEAGADTPYACPSCGTTLFAACRRCDAPRHTLLPFCEHCGDELVAAEPAPAS